MNVIITFVVLILYPFVALRRYFEYKYTKPKEARELLQTAGGGLIGLVLFYLNSGFPITVFGEIICFLAIWIYWLCMLAFIKINQKLQGKTPA